MTKASCGLKNYSVLSESNNPDTSLENKRYKIQDNLFNKEENKEVNDMTFDITYNANKAICIVRIRGPVDVAMQKQIIPQVLAHPLWNKSCNLLFDYSESSLGHLQTRDIHNLSQLMRSYSKQLGMIKLALVMCGDVNFGLGRMWLAYTVEHMDCDMSIFRSSPDAESWLQASTADA